jgi:hypothetical protein
MIRKKPFSFPGISPGQAAWLLLFLLLLLERVGPSGVVPSVAEEISLGKSSVPALAAGVENLESTDGGWTPGGPTNNWEHGVIVPGVFENCGFTAWPYPEPSAAHSGSRVWGTKLNGCYENFNGSSALSKTFDLAGRPANLELRWWHWLHVFVPYDQARVLVNDQEVWRAPDNLPTAGWVQQKVNLSAFSGQEAVTIQFVLEATSEVNRMGWYLDDIEIAPYSIYLPLIFKY